jgi:predicted O-methyltransferase YrrM
MITDPKVEAYLTAFVPERTELLTRLEQEAADEGIPIIQLLSAQFLFVTVKAHNPKRILEVGTAIGYSAIWLAQAAPEAEIVTLELDEKRAERARQNLAEAGLAHRVRVELTDATQWEPDGEFDCLFIDAAKGQYPVFLERFLLCVKKGGLVVTDNILFKGYVVSPELTPERQTNMVEKIRQFNRQLAEHPQLSTSFVPIGDGIAVSVKR